MSVRKPFLAVLLVTASALCGQDRPWILPRPCWSHTTDVDRGRRTQIDGDWGSYVMILEGEPQRAARPAGDLEGRLSVEWEPLVQATPRCIRVCGRLLVDADGGLRPVEWLQGVRILVAREPNAETDWSTGHDRSSTAWHDGFVDAAGRFGVGFETSELVRLVVAGGEVQVGLALAGHREGEVEFSKTTHPLAGSVTQVAYLGVPELDLDGWLRRVNTRDFDRSVEAPTYELLPIPRLEPFPDPKVGSALEREIEVAIDALVEIDSAGMGYSPARSGSRFLPVPGTCPPGRESSSPAATACPH